MSGTSGATSPKAAFVVIGDEILSGKIQDTNTHALGALAAHAGWKEPHMRPQS